MYGRKSVGFDEKILACHIVCWTCLLFGWVPRIINSILNARRVLIHRIDIPNLHVIIINFAEVDGERTNKLRTSQVNPPPLTAARRRRTIAGRRTRSGSNIDSESGSLGCTQCSGLRRAAHRAFLGPASPLQVRNRGNIGILVRGASAARRRRAAGQRRERRRTRRARAAARAVEPGVAGAACD